MYDDTTDCLDKTQMELYLSYATNETPVERFRKFINPENQTATVLSRTLIHELQTILGNDHKR